MMPTWTRVALLPHRRRLCLGALTEDSPGSRPKTCARLPHGSGLRRLPVRSTPDSLWMTSTASSCLRCRSKTTRHLRNIGRNRPRRSPNSAEPCGPRSWGRPSAWDLVWLSPWQGSPPDTPPHGRATMSTQPFGEINPHLESWTSTNSSQGYIMIYHKKSNHLQYHVI